MIIKKYFKLAENYCIEHEYDDDFFDPKWNEISKEEYLDWKNKNRNFDIPVVRNNDAQV